MDKKMKYIKKFESFRRDRYDKYDKINEGISTSAALAAIQVAMSLGGGSPTIGLEQAMKQQQLQLQESRPGVKIDLKIAVGRASAPQPDEKGVITRSEEKSHYAYYKGADLEGYLEKCESYTDNRQHYFKGSKSDIMKAIKDKKIDDIFENFENISAEKAKVSKITLDSRGVDVTDYLKIGDQEVLGEGKLVFNLDDNDEEIIVSGNGLYALIRIAESASEALDEIEGGCDIAIAEIGVKAKEDKTFKSREIIALNSALEKEAFFTVCYYMFEMTTEMGDMNIDGNSYANKHDVVEMRGMSDDQKVDAIYDYINSGLNDFVVDNGPELTLEVVSKKEIKETMKRFQDVFSDKGGESLEYFIENNISQIDNKLESIFSEFLQKSMKVYGKNLNNYVDKLTDGKFKRIENVVKSIDGISKKTNFTNSLHGNIAHVHYTVSSKEVSRQKRISGFTKGGLETEPGKISGEKIGPSRN